MQTPNQKKFRSGATWILVGKGPSKDWLPRYLAQYPGAIVGTLNDTRLPEGTTPAFHADIHPGREDTLRDLESAGIPVLSHPTSTLRTAIAFPLPEIEARFRTRYFSHGVPEIIAWILLHDPARICLPGCDYWPDQGAPGEFNEQRPCTEWWLGFAWGRGVDIVFPKFSFLLTGVGYGREIYAMDDAFPPAHDVRACTQAEISAIAGSVQRMRARELVAEVEKTAATAAPEARAAAEKFIDKFCRDLSTPPETREAFLSAFST